MLLELPTVHIKNRVTCLNTFDILLLDWPVRKKESARGSGVGAVARIAHASPRLANFFLCKDAIAQRRDNRTVLIDIELQRLIADVANGLHAKPRLRWR